MGKLLGLQEHKNGGKSEQSACTHRQVVVYPVERAVRCVTCGKDLDPFVVLVDMVMGYVPEDGENEAARMDKEMKRRSNSRKAKEPVHPDGSTSS